MPYSSSITYTKDNLIAGDYPIVRKEITLLLGTSYVRGTLLGKITKSTPTTGTAGTNTGNGTCTSVLAGLKTKLGSYALTCLGQTGSAISMPATGTAGTNTGNGTCTGVTAGSSAKAGSYQLKCIATATNGGTFEVRAPTGERLPDATVGVAYVNPQINFTINDGSTDFAANDTFTIAATAVNGGLFSVTDPEGNKMPDAVVGVAYNNAQLNFTINDGSTDYVAGDTFTIAVTTPSSEIYKTALAASVDGSQELDTACILTSDVDATSENQVAVGYITGQFNQNGITFGTGFTAANTAESLAKRGIFLVESVAA